MVALVFRGVVFAIIVTKVAGNCPVGKYGKNCEKDCSVNCAPIYGLVHCLRVSGECAAGCLTGWYGDQCGRPCSKYCLKNICNQHNGHCTHGCPRNRVGDFCENSTANICKEDQQCSDCNMGCRNNSCEVIKSSRMKCTDGCNPGYQDTDCSRPCSTSVNCMKCPQKCDGQYCQLGSSCVSGCNDSYYGSDCKNCSLGCKSCNRITGKCNECHKSFTVSDCEPQCKNCSGPCDVTGACANGCRPGYFGANCAQCHENCVSHMCHPGNGSCVIGCVKGFYGEFCNQSCFTCVHGICLQKTGECSQGCEVYFGGRRCEHNCSSNCSISYCRTMDICAKGPNQDTVRSHKVLVAGIVISLLIAALTVAVSVSCLRTRRLNQRNRVQLNTVSRQVDTSNTGYESLHVYVDIREEHMDIAMAPIQDQEHSQEEASVHSMPVLAEHFNETNDTDPEEDTTDTTDNSTRNSDPCCHVMYDV